MSVTSPAFSRLLCYLTCCCIISSSPNLRVKMYFISFAQVFYFNNAHLTYYLPYKVYTVLVIMSVVPINMTAFYTFTIISFFNRCLNPFIYASQYEVMRRFWTPLIDFLRRHVARKPVVTPAIRIEPISTSAASRSGQQLPTPVP